MKKEEETKKKKKKKKKKKAIPPRDWQVRSEVLDEDEYDED